MVCPVRFDSLNPLSLLEGCSNLALFPQELGTIHGCFVQIWVFIYFSMHFSILISYSYYFSMYGLLPRVMYEWLYEFSKQINSLGCHKALCKCYTMP